MAGGWLKGAHNQALLSPYPPLPYLFWTLWTWGFTGTLRSWGKNAPRNAWKQILKFWAIVGHSEVAQNELSVTVILSLQKVTNKIDNQESAELKFYQGQRRTDSISISGSFLLHIMPTLLHIAPTLHVEAQIKASPIRHRRDTPLSTHCLHKCSMNYFILSPKQVSTKKISLVTVADLALHWTSSGETTITGVEVKSIW